MSNSENHSNELAGIVGRNAVLSTPEDLMLYEYDGSVERARPQAVVFASALSDQAHVARMRHDYFVP